MTSIWDVRTDCFSKDRSEPGAAPQPLSRRVCVLNYHKILQPTHTVGPINRKVPGRALGMPQYNQSKSMGGELWIHNSNVVSHFE